MSIKFTKCGFYGQSTDNPECHTCPNETMENKIHSYNLLNSKFEIAKKEIHKHLQSISDWMRMTDERLEEISDHDERIHDLENISAEKRLLDLQIQVNGFVNIIKQTRELDQYLGIAIDRIEKLEQEKVIYKQNTIDRIHARLNILEQMHTENIYKPIESGKRPHKCPVCDGCGNSKGQIEQNPNYEFYMKYASCNSCDGKGIVWG